MSPAPSRSGNRALLGSRPEGRPRAFVTTSAYTAFRGFYETAFTKLPEKRFPSPDRASNALRPGRTRQRQDWLDMPAGRPNVPPATLQMTDWPESGARKRVAQNDRRQR
jgi:hypothetical protein